MIEVRTIFKNVQSSLQVVIAGGSGESSEGCRRQSRDVVVVWFRNRGLNHVCKYKFL